MDLQANSRGPAPMRRCSTCHGSGYARDEPTPGRKASGQLDRATLRAVVAYVEQRLRTGSGAADLKLHLRWLRRMIARHSA